MKDAEENNLCIFKNEEDAIRKFVGQNPTNLGRREEDRKLFWIILGSTQGFVDRC